MNTPACYARALGRAVVGSLRDGHSISIGLFRFLIPIVLAVKILTELGALTYLAMPLRPVMNLVDLPAELGLAWAAAMLVNIYSGILVFLSLAPGLPDLTTAQMTTFGLMVLIAHSLVLETRIAGQCGLSMPVQLFLRLGMALLAGLLFHGLTVLTGTLSGPAHILLRPDTTPVTLTDWALSELVSLGKIYLLVWAVMLFQRGMDHFRLSDFCGWLLRPVLNMLGIAPGAATIIIVGFSMGLIYGSGIIIKKVREGMISRHDAFCAMSFMGIAHSLIEDTLLLALLGSSPWGTLGLRLVLALAAGVAIRHLYHRFAPSSGTGNATLQAASSGTRAGAPSDTQPENASDSGAAS